MSKKIKSQLIRLGSAKRLTKGLDGVGGELRHPSDAVLIPKTGRLPRRGGR
jgi:hypothetical protein